MDARLSDAVFASPAPTLGGPGPPAPVPATPKVRTARVRVTSEAVGVRGALGGYYTSLPPWIDDLTREYGPETYERMQLDDQVSSSLRALCHGVTADDLVLRPGVADRHDADFGPAKDALGFCERATWQQTGGLDQWLLTMVKGAVGGGNRVSETVYRYEESGKDAGKWVPDRLKVKPRRSVAFAVDSCNNLTGILGLPPGGATWGGATWGGLAWGATFDPADPPDNFLPRDKFCVLTWDPHDEDPRGSSLLRCVYEPWWAKLQAAREWLAYLAQFGSPGMVGTTAPGADSSAPTDAYGNVVDGPVLTPEQDMLNKVIEHRNGGVHIIPAGATLTLLQSSNAGDAFLKKVDSCDRAIAQGINLAMRAVMQSRFGSRADAEQGQDVAGLQTRFMKRWLARMVTEDLLRPLVRINYGPDAARRLCPYASLSPVEHQDLGASLVAVSGAWKNGLIKNSQLPWVYEQFGMPPATEEELAAPPPGSVPPGAEGGGPGGGGGQDPLAQALLKQGPPGGGAAPFAFNPGQSRGQPENRGQFGPGGGGAGPVEHGLSAGEPRTVAQLARATGLSKDEVANRLAALHREGRLETGVSRGNPTYRLKGPPSAPAPPPAAGREQREEEAVLAEIRSLLPAHPDGMVPISRVRRAVAAKYGTAAAGPALDDVLFRLRYDDRVRLIVASDLSALSPEDRAGSIQGMGELYHSVSLPEIAVPFAWDESKHPRTAPDLSGLGDLLNLSRQEVLDALFDAALDSFDLALPDAAFYSPDQPRVPAGQPGGGRWAGGVSPGTTAARNAASDAVRDFARGQGPPTAREAHALAGHLAKLTVAQLHTIKAQHGLKGSAPNKAALVAKLAQRFRDARAAAAAPAAPAPPQPFAGTYQQWVAAGRPGLAPGGTPAVSAPLPPSAYSPMTPPAVPAPAPASVLNRGANVITGAPAKAAVPVVPFAAERAWETGKPEPGVLNGIPFAPAPPKFWEKAKDVDVGEPPPARPVNRAGVLIREPDGRVWIVQPTNQFGNRKHTLPGGGVEPGLTNQQNALKEVWEETGLQVEITGYAGDFEDSNNGNNGRLYLGRRVGGAPWDAKVESFIVSNKTGNPAAESETITLVTPERAAQLLHRTDDLAQLMVAHPPPVDTPTRGKGSEPLKKLLAAVGPAAKEYERKRKAAGAYPGNAEMHAVQEMRGFNAKPRVVSKADFDALVAKGDHVEVLRGVKDHGYGASRVTGKQLADQYREGEHFPGHGIFGSGTYVDSTKGHGNVASGYAGRYGGGGGELLRMALPKNAKIIKESDLEKAVPQSPAAFAGYQASGGKLPRECWMGVQAALAGYDAIHVDGKSAYHGSYGEGFYVILNRSVVTVQDKAPPAGYVIP